MEIITFKCVYKSLNMNGKVLSRKIFKDNVCVLLLNNTSFSYRHRPLVNSPTHIYIHKACRIQGISNHKMFKKVLWYEGHILEEHLKNENYDVWQNHKNLKQDDNIIISTWIDILALRYLKSILCVGYMRSSVISTCSCRSIDIT